MPSILQRCLSSLLSHPRLVLVGFATLLIVAAIGLQGFRLDASADSLLLENDQALQTFREVNRTFGSGDEFVVITYTPKDELFSPAGIAQLTSLRNDINAIQGVGGTISILDVPLLYSPDLSLENVSEQIRTIDDHAVEPSTAKSALLNNPLYPNLLISKDARTTAIQAFINPPDEFTELFNHREALRESLRQQLDSAIADELSKVEKDYIAASSILQHQRDALISELRAVLAKYQGSATLFLGGVPMIAVDMIHFIKSDISTFGIGILVFLFATLWAIFRQWKLVVLPLLGCGATALLVAGYLGWRDWPVTVISSNFISLLMIISLSLIIHLVVRYREYQLENPDKPNAETLRQTVLAMMPPCFFMAITTIVAFSSFTLSGILPVIDFGWMMTLGLVIAFVITFVAFLALLSLFPPSHLPSKNTNAQAITNGAPSSGQKLAGASLTAWLADFTHTHITRVLLVSILLGIVSAVGINKLTVENSFVDYFKPSTEIFQGMVTIDRELGGTTPLDIIITDEPAPEGFAEVDPNCDPFVEDCGEAAEYRDTWFTYKKIALLEQVHNYLDSLSETGKVISIKTTLDLITQINQGKPLADFELEFVPKKTPSALRGILVDPYISEANKQARFSVRLMDSLPELKRNELLKEIRRALVEDIGISEDRVQLSGMMVLYNNMLQSLFDSQIKTLGFVFVAILLMFFILFRSVKVALIGMTPNVLAALSLLGLMGGLGVPLDLMTITVAAITIGIAVDDTIHYIHRFKIEITKDGDYFATMHRCHSSIAMAMCYTTLTIVIGFSILVLSNFYPTIYFGLFTGFAMCVALLLALTLLPALIIVFKPFGTHFPIQSAGVGSAGAIPTTRSTKPTH